MLIDWFTVGAQLLNFLVLVWLMKRYLYGPVLAAIAAREQATAATLQDAAARLAAAQALDAQAVAKNTAFDQQRDQLLAAAVNAAQVQNAALLEQGKAADAALRAQAATALGAEQDRMSASVTLQARDAVLASVRQALADLGDDAMEDAMVRAFIRKLASLGAPERARLAGANAEVRSAAPLSAQQQAALTTALDACGVQPPLTFSCAPELVCGIELRVPGWSLAFNLDQYVHALTQHSTARLAA
jgi:F-type H+-transporting ATPase subunit b